MEKRYKTLVTNLGIFAIGNLLVKLISFFLMPLYTIALVPEQYGISELLNNTVEIVLPIATLSIIESLYRFSIDDDNNHTVVFMNSFYTLMVGSAILGVICVIIKKYTSYEYIYDFFLLYLTSTLYKWTLQFARGRGHAKRFVFYGILNSIILLISTIFFLVILRGGVKEYLLSFSLGYGLTAVVAFIISEEYKYFSIISIDKVVMRQMLRYSLPSIPNLIAWWINSLSDRYILLLFSGAKIAGVYTAASKLPALVNVFSSIFQQAWQYSTAKELSNSSSNIFFSKVFRMYTYTCLIICSTIMSFNIILCKLILGVAFYSAWRFLPLLLLAVTFGCISTYFGSFYSAKKENKMLMVSTVLGAFLNIFLNLLLIPTFNGLGAAIATAASYFMVAYYRMHDVLKTINLDINKKRLTIQFCLLLFNTIITTSLNSYIGIVLGLILTVILIFTDVSILINLYEYLSRISKKDKNLAL